MIGTIFRVLVSHYRKKLTGVLRMVMRCKILQIKRYNIAQLFLGCKRLGDLVKMG